MSPCCRARSWSPWFWVCGLFFWAVGCQGPRSAPEATGYSLVLVTLDTVRADHLGAYGGQGVATPVLDGLATQGARFAEVMSTAPLTLPAHASLFTGRLPPQHGLRLNGQGRLPADIPTLAEHLQAGGYATAAFVGAFVLDSRFGLDRGFDHYDDAIGRSEQGLAPRLEAERPAGEIVDRASAWLRERPADRPVFTWLHFYDAHAPYQPPGAFAQKFAARPYAGEIAYVDQELGRFLKVLAEVGRQERTVVAVVADHGESLGEFGEATHGLLLYQGALGIPWIVAAPGAITGGLVVQEPASLVDVAPTLAALVGRPWLPCSGEGCGHDFSPALRGLEANPPPRPLYAETEYPATFGWSPLAALRSQHLKLIASPRPELFDLRVGEKTNLADAERRAFRELEERLDGLRASARSLGTAVDAETQRQLAALGYVGGGRAGQAKIGEGAHPLDRMADYSHWEEAEKLIAAGGENAVQGEASLRRLVAADPRNPVFRTSLARWLRQRGLAREALPLYRQALADAPTDPDVWQNLASVLFEAGALAEAAAAARHTLSLDPGRPEALNLLGVCELSQGEMAQAEDHFRAVLKIDPANATAWNNLGNLMAAHGRFELAAEAFGRATELAPRYADPWSGLGAAWIAGDQPQRAIPALLRALELDPAFEEARLNLAIAYQQAGELTKAKQLYRELVERTRDQPRFAAQHQAARQLLAAL